MLRRPCFLCLIALVSIPAAAGAQPGKAFRPPAVPLVTHDPYFSVWSMSDRLTDDWTKHWTGATQAMCGLIRIDGKPYRFMGPARLKVPAMTQLSVEVLPTRTIYQFAQDAVRLTLTFTTPALLDDLDVLARPITYVTFDVRATDQKPHDVALYFDCTGELAVDRPEQSVVWGRYKVGDVTDVLRIGSKDQAVLAKAGDNLRIDWGYFTLAAPHPLGRETGMTSDRLARGHFIDAGRLPDDDDLRMPRPAQTIGRCWRVSTRLARSRPSRCRASLWSATTTVTPSSTSASGCVRGGGATGWRWPSCCASPNATIHRCRRTARSLTPS